MEGNGAKRTRSAGFKRFGTLQNGIMMHENASKRGFQRTELNPIENVSEYLRGDKLAITVFGDYDDIVDKICGAWNSGGPSDRRGDFVLDRIAQDTNPGNLDLVHVALLHPQRRYAVNEAEPIKQLATGASKR